MTRAAQDESLPMVNSADRPFDWIALLAVVTGAAVVLISLAVLGVSLASAVSTLFQYLL
jgi:hypothetical protein